MLEHKDPRSDIACMQLYRHGERHAARDVQSRQRGGPESCASLSCIDAPSRRLSYMQLSCFGDAFGRQNHAFRSLDLAETLLQQMSLQSLSMLSSPSSLKLRVFSENEVSSMHSDSRSRIISSLKPCNSHPTPLSQRPMLARTLQTWGDLFLCHPSKAPGSLF